MSFGHIWTPWLTPIPQTATLTEYQPPLNFEHCTLNFEQVYGDSICFSLLPDFRDYFESTNTPKTAFWNPTRTVRSFLEDLAVFLFVDEDQHKTITKDMGILRMREARGLCCLKCKHKGATAVNPNRSDGDAAATSGGGAAAAAAATPALTSPPSPTDGAVATTSSSPTPSVQDVEAYLEAKGVHALLARCLAAVSDAQPSDPAAFLAKALADGTLLEASGASALKPTAATEPVGPEIPRASAEGLVCSITGEPWDADGVVIGFGVHVVHQQGRMTITTDLTPMSQTAFYEDGIRVSAMGAQINAWLPFVINHRNWTVRGAAAAAHDVGGCLCRSGSCLFPRVSRDFFLWLCLADGS
jgi:hypothetical protein